MWAALQKPAVWRNAALSVLALAPIIYLLALVNKYGIDVPYADDFTVAPLLAKAHDHAVTWSDLFAQHNEHRYFFPRLIMIACAWMARGDLRAEMFFSVFLTASVSVNLWFLIRKTTSTSVPQSIVLLFLINLLLFSPVQAENWTWGFQFPLFLCNFLFSSSLLVAVSRLHLTIKFFVCLVFAFIATFSFGGGVVHWALTFPIVLLTHDKQAWKSRVAWGVAWGAAGVGAVALYFLHYVMPPHHPGIGASANPADYFFYVATFLGAHLSRASHNEPFFQAALIGTVLLGLWGAAFLYAFRYRSDRSLTKPMIPWLALGAYAMLNALLAAVARIGYGINQALDSRYTSFSVYLSIAAIGLIAILRKDILCRGNGRRFEGALGRFETILLTAFAAFSLSAFSWGRSFMIDSQRSRLLGKAALLFSNVMDTGEIHDRCLMANAPEAREYANLLDRIGFLHPRMLSSAEIGKLKWTDKEGEAGFLDLVSRSGQSCVAVGWAVLPTTRTPAHCVVLSYLDPNRGPIAFQVADGVYNRSDVVASRHNPAAEASGGIVILTDPFCRRAIFR